MKEIIEGKRTLAEFHCEVNKALNVALTNLDMETSDDPTTTQHYATQEDNSILCSHNAKELKII